MEEVVRQLTRSQTYLLAPYPFDVPIRASYCISSGTCPLLMSQPNVDAIEDMNMNRGFGKFGDDNARSMRFRVARMLDSNDDKGRMKWRGHAL